MRGVAALALVLGGLGVAEAGPTRKVTIETSPPGAVVYLSEKEAGPACQPTPCKIDAPVGETPIIIELADHQQIFENLVVPRRGKIKVPVFQLVRAIGVIVVAGPRGATVTISEVEQDDKAPLRAEVPAQGHHVVVELGGKALYDDFIEVSAGGETEIEVPGADGAPGDGDAGSGDDDDGDGDGDGDDPLGGKLAASATTAPARAPYLRVSFVLDVGFRHFTYDGVETPQTLREETEGGQLLGGPLIEVWPASLVGIRALRGLSLLGRLQFGLNSQQVAGNGIMNPTNTFWQSLELSLRHRWTLADKFTLEVGGGYVRDQFQFEGTANDILLVPDADYQAIRLGLRASILLGRFEPYVSAENRFVTSGGKLAVRFRAASASGLRAALGIGARHGAFLGRLEASTTRYSWDFTFETMDERRATGGTDAITQLQLVVGYQY